MRLATTWMNEEWYNDQIRSARDREWVRSSISPRDGFTLIILICQRPNYETWLNQIVASYQTTLDGKDKTFARFLLDLPSLPTDVLDLLRDLCLDISRCASSLFCSFVVVIYRSFQLRKNASWFYDSPWSCHSAAIHENGSSECLA
jgi:hypothetical protein